MIIQFVLALLIVRLAVWIFCVGVILFLALLVGLYMRHLFRSYVFIQNERFSESPKSRRRRSIYS